MIFTPNNGKTAGRPSEGSHCNAVLLLAQHRGLRVSLLSARRAPLQRGALPLARLCPRLRRPCSIPPGPFRNLRHPVEPPAPATRVPHVAAGAAVDGGARRTGGWRDGGAARQAARACAAPPRLPPPPRQVRTAHHWLMTGAATAVPCQCHPHRRRRRAPTRCSRLLPPRPAQPPRAPEGFFHAGLPAPSAARVAIGGGRGGCGGCFFFFFF